MANVALRAFTSGEVAPSFYARTDVQRYASALRTCRNFIVMREGGVTNRPGTEFVALCPFGSVVRLIRFEYNADQAYLLEFSDRMIRVFADGGSLGVGVTSPYLAADLAALQVTQSADVMTITHASYPVYELRRLSAVAWSLGPIVFGAGIDPPTNLVVSPNGLAISGVSVNWAVTAINDNGAESFVSNIQGYVSSFGGISTSHPAQSLAWTAVAGAVSYNVYKSYQDGGWGFVANTEGTVFLDTGLAPDFSTAPPHELADFGSAGEYPSAVGGFQQRRIFAGSTDQPETFWLSRTGDLSTFTESTPIQDDDAIEGTLVSNRVNAIRHIVDADALFLLSAGGEWLLRGDGAGVIRPTDINALNFSKHGSSILPPIVIDRRVLYVQARQSIVRQIVTNDVGPGYIGENLTLLASHLFKGYTLVDWAYAEEPHAVVWCVRSDGVLLGVTTLAEQDVLAWHRHDTDGLVENVCVVPEGDEDVLYLVVNRGGIRMLERMHSRFFTDVRDAVFMDSTLTYDGRNTSSETMTLSGSTSWDDQELVTVTRSGSGFSLAEVGNAIDFTPDDGLPLRVTLTDYVSVTEMQGFPSRTIPADLQNVATTTWTRAANVLSGLDHLEGKAVSVFGDGYVVASPNNPDVSTVVTVSSGAVTLPQPYGYVHVGLPYLSDLETLDIDTPSGRSLKDGKINVKKVTTMVDASRAFFAGQSFPTGADPLENLDEAKIRDVSDDYGLPSVVTDTLDIPIASNFTKGGRFVIRHVDPSPLTILALIPRGEIG